MGSTGLSVYSSASCTLLKVQHVYCIYDWMMLAEVDTRHEVHVPIGDAAFRGCHGRAYHSYNGLQMNAKFDAQSIFFLLDWTRQLVISAEQVVDKALLMRPSQ